MRFSHILNILVNKGYSKYVIAVYTYIYIYIYKEGENSPSIQFYSVGYSKATCSISQADAICSLWIWFIIHKPSFIVTNGCNNRVRSTTIIPINQPSNQVTTFCDSILFNKDLNTLYQFFWNRVNSWNRNHIRDKGDIPPSLPKCLVNIW